MTTITDAIADRTAAIKSVADQADEMLDYFYLNLGLKRPSNNEEE
ncbi:MAG: hypothetical protein WC886_07925 [Saccharofermentanaceae bacterium]|jgi:hypothetical protein